MAGRNEMSVVDSLKLKHVGQIARADAAVGDLKVLVGPQATGRSIFLQFLKLVAVGRCDKACGAAMSGRLAACTPARVDT